MSASLDGTEADGTVSSWEAPCRNRHIGGTGVYPVQKIHTITAYSNTTIRQSWEAPCLAFSRFTKTCQSWEAPCLAYLRAMGRG